VQVIHYHGTPMTPVADMVKAFSGRHAMVSFEHPEQMEICAEICQSVVLDNGAFSAWRQGKDHDFSGYIDWCEKWLKHPCVDWCVIPDVIDGTLADNEWKIWSFPFPREQSVPVYHLHEPLEHLLELRRSFPRIALGSSGKWADPGSNDWWIRITEVMEVLCDDAGAPLVKIHGLRMLDPGIFSKLPFASADSCNVARNVGLDNRWKGTYIPTSRAVRALILMDRIERHASSSFWNASAICTYQNMDLIG
jgi:hypothetical protein